MLYLHVARTDKMIVEHEQDLTSDCPRSPTEISLTAIWIGRKESRQCYGPSLTERDFPGIEKIKRKDPTSPVMGGVLFFYYAENRLHRLLEKTNPKSTF